MPTHCTATARLGRLLSQDPPQRVQSTWLPDLLKYTNSEADKTAKPKPPRWAPQRMDGFMVLPDDLFWKDDWDDDPGDVG